MSMEITTYQLASSLIAKGMDWKQAVGTVPEQGFPIDVTFPGEGEPDQVDEWISAHAEPFYIRT